MSTSSSGKDDSNFSYDSLDLWILMSRVDSLIRRSCELELAPLGLTTEQASILDNLSRVNGSASIADIANATVRQYNSVTTLVNRMIKTGLISKERTPNNGRYMIHMTDKGKKLHIKITTNAIEMAFYDLPIGEKQKLFEILKMLLEKSRKNLGMDFRPPFLEPVSSSQE